MRFIRLYIFLLSIFPIISSAEITRPHLYRISGNGVQSVMFGTIHLGVHVDDLPPVVMEEILKAEQIYLESDLKYFKSYLSNESLIKFSDTIDTFAKTQTIDSEREQGLSRILAQNGIGDSLIKYLVSDSLSEKTYTAGGIMYLPLIYENRWPMLDALIAVQVERIKGPTFPFYRLETAEVLAQAKAAQARAEGEAPDAEPAQLTIDNWLTNVPQIFERIPAILKSYESGVENSEQEYDYSKGDLAVAMRNSYWIKILAPQLRARPTAVVAGMNHLYGSKGLIAGLRKLGFKVERINAK